MEYKKKYKGKVIGVRGYGLLNTNEVKAETVAKLSKKFPKLSKFIESAKESKKSSDK